MILSISLFVLLMYRPFAFAETQKLSTFPEHKIKAVYLYKFIHFIKWPEEIQTSENITIGILGKDDFSEVEGKRIKSLGKSKRPVHKQNKQAYG